MLRNPLRSAARALPLFIGAAILSCGEAPTQPKAVSVVALGATPAQLVTIPELVISQVYGGGGNATATLKNDFIELFNPGTTPVNLAGWSVQYASSAGTAWTNITNLSGAVPPGGYYLVQEAAGAGGTVNLPTPDASGGIAMSATAGKVALSKSTVAFVAGTCPAGAALVDFVSYGTASTNCGSGTTATLANATAAVRNTNGCAYTGVLSADFSVAAPTPRNSASPTNTCAAPAVPASVGVTPDSTGVFIGSTTPFTATARDAANNVVGTTFTWTSSDNAIATVNASGVATGVAEGLVTITATSANAIVGTARLSVTTAPPPSATNVHVVEIHYDNTGTDADEQIEITGTTGGSLTGWSIVLYNFTGGAAYQTIPLSGVFPAGCGANGVIVVPAPGLQNGPQDGIAVVNSAGTVVEFLSYEGVLTATDGPALGQTSVDIGVSESGNETLGKSLLRAGDGTWYGPTTSSFGVCNPDTKPVFPNSIGFSGRNSSDPALPVGFEDQLFATLRDGMTGGTIPSTFTWTAETPTIATIDADGVMHALSAGSATFRATAADGTTGTWTLPTTVPLASFTALYGNNTEFGDPVDGDPSDDFIIRRAQFTTSFNKNRNTPNWVAYNLEATHIGSEVDRCDCFTHDPLLPASFTHINTNDYTGSGAFAGYGIDRGHLARSFDRTSGALDNAFTYLLSNIIPQAADLNQGPWAILENELGDSARIGGREVYIVAGVAGNKGTLKGEGKVVIPSAVWKVAVIMPRDHGLADVRTWHDVTVIAIIAPNDAGVRGVDWHTWMTTVDAVEALSGYDLLSLLPDKIENAVESNSKPPVAALNGPFAGNEGSPVSMSGATSVDYNGSVVGYEWTFGDGSVASGANVTHPYAQDGLYTVRLIVTDNDGLADTLSTTATVANVAPVATFNAPAAVNEGSAIALSLTGASDPGTADMIAGLRFAFDCGDGSGYGAVGSTATASCATSRVGSHTVRGKVVDQDGGFTEYSSTVGVNNVPPAPTLGLSALTILSGQSVTATGSFTDPGANSPWSYLLNWGSGANATGSLAASGATTTASRQYLMAGSYTVAFTVTDADGAVGTSSLQLDVARRSMSAEVDPKSIKLNENGNGSIKITLRSTTIDLRTLDLSSVKIGSVGIAKKGNGDFKAEVQVAEVQIQFERKALIEAGMLAPGTTEIVLLGNLTTGVQVVAKGAVSVH